MTEVEELVNITKKLKYQPLRGKQRGGIYALKPRVVFWFVLFYVSYDLCQKQQQWLKELLASAVDFSSLASQKPSATDRMQAQQDPQTPAPPLPLSPLIGIPRLQQAFLLNHSHSWPSTARHPSASSASFKERGKVK